MKVYNILFYYIYELALRSKSNRDMPMFITVTVITLCVMFNVFSFFFLLEGMGILEVEYFKKEYRFIGASVFLVLVASYYLYNGRYKKIYGNFVKQRSKKPSTFKAIAIVILFYILSFVGLVIAGMFRNQTWIFAPV